MTKANYDVDFINYDLNAIVEEANEARALYIKEIFSDAAKKLTNLLAIELPKFIPSPLAHR